MSSLFLVLDNGTIFLTDIHLLDYTPAGAALIRYKNTCNIIWINLKFTCKGYCSSSWFYYSSETVFAVRNGGLLKKYGTCETKILSTLYGISYKLWSSNPFGMNACFTILFSPNSLVQTSKKSLNSLSLWAVKIAYGVVLAELDGLVILN